jgi:septal ring factor EnvC (AmiA/AmiB activator)
MLALSLSAGAAHNLPQDQQHCDTFFGLLACRCCQLVLLALACGQVVQQPPELEVQLVNAFFCRAKRSAAANDMADVSTDITYTKTELHDVKQEIAKLNKRLDENDFTERGRYSSQEKVEAVLQDLRGKETQLNNQLQTLYDTRKIALAQQQQQSGAGTSMLPVRQEDVILPGQTSCCIHQQTLQLSECVLSHATLHSCGLCC